MALCGPHAAGAIRKFTMVCIEKRLEGLAGLIGNTPLLEISFTIHGAARKIYAKAENFNLTGSIKDRMALHIFKKG